MTESSTTAALQSLLTRFAAGEAGAKNALVAVAHDRLMVIARGQLRRFPGVRREEETAGILGASYQRLSKALDDVRPATVRAFFGLAALQMRRVLLDLVPSRNAPPRPPVIDLPSGSGPPGRPDPGELRFGLREDMLTALEQLPDDEREVVDLLIFAGLTQREAAEVLDVHEDTVKRRWARARMKLADVLEDYAASE